MRFRFLGLALVGLAATPGAGLAQSSDSAFRAAIAGYTRSHQAEILGEFRELLAIPNRASDSINIRRNAAAISAMLQRRGATTRLLESPTGGPPVVFGELRTPGAARTVVLYAHYDGQPVEAGKWATPPWEPTLRDGPLEHGGRVVPFPAAGDTTNPNGDSTPVRRGTTRRRSSPCSRRSMRCARTGCHRA